MAHMKNSSRPNTDKNATKMTRRRTMLKYAQNKNSESNPETQGKEKIQY
jgi:hypothetical protein